MVFLAQYRGECEVKSGVWVGSPSLAAPAEIPLPGEPFWHESQAAKWVRNRENESAALEPDRKCKIKDEGGEVQMAFFAFL